MTNDVVPRSEPLRALHLCSGYGGFELALRHARIPARTVAHVERDSYAAATLVARMAEARLDQAPIWSDLATFDCEPWRGRVDLITAGLPCQPFSAAGNQLGLEDERHLWPHALRIISALRPRFVVLENVPDVVRAGWLAHVLADLATLGFDAEWGMFRASAVGAPHQRERFWLVAYPDRDRCESVGRCGTRDECDSDGCDGSHVAYAKSSRCERDRGAIGDGPEHAGSISGSSTVGDAESVGRVSGDRPAPPGQDGRRVADATDRHVWPPHRDDHDGWADYIAEGGPEPIVRRGADGRPPWLADSLHLGGNGLVPQCAAAAIVALAERAGISFV